jgi:hypothetical protein
MLRMLLAAASRLLRFDLRRPTTTSSPWVSVRLSCPSSTRELSPPPTVVSENAVLKCALKILGAGSTGSGPDKTECGLTIELEFWNVQQVRV